MPQRELSVLSKYNWYRTLTEEYKFYLKSKNISKEKSKKLVILFGWSLDYIFYNTDWEIFYPEWRKDAQTGYPIKIENKSSHKRKLLNNKSLFLFKRILDFFRKIFLKFFIQADFNFLKNNHQILFIDNIRVIFIKKLIGRSDKAKIEKEKFFKKLKKIFKDLSLYECIISIIPDEFFDLEVEYKNLIINTRCEKFVSPEMIKLLNKCKSSFIIHHSHGSVTGWYFNNYFENKILDFSDKFINWDIRNKDTFTRYYIKPRKREKTKIFWVTRPDLNQFYYDMIPNINYRKKSGNTLEQHLDEIFRVLKPFGFHFLLHPKGQPAEYKKYHNEALTLNKFDQKKVSKNDIFIFDSINSSLIFYTLKFSLNFLIYENNIPSETTKRYKILENYFQKGNYLFYNNIKDFKVNLDYLISKNNIS